MDQQFEAQEGIYFNMPEEQYHATHALSASGVKALAVSPLQYWHQNFNPEREEKKDTTACRFGRAVHCRLLEPERYATGYAPALAKLDYPDAMVTTEELREWLRTSGGKVSGNKPDLISRIKAMSPKTQIWDDIVARHAERFEGRVILPGDESALVESIGSAVDCDPAAKAMLAGGSSEVSLFVRDPHRGVMLKCRIDKLKAGATIDLKTFSNSRGKDVRKAVFQAIYYEGYYLQTCFYTYVRELVRARLATLPVHGGDASMLESKNYGFGFVFVESAQPHDIVSVELRPRETPKGERNLYWQNGMTHVLGAIQQYAELKERFGASPWRETSEQPHVLTDLDLPQMIYA